MGGARRRARAASALLMGLALAVVPAGGAKAKGWLRPQETAASAPYVVYRPAYQEPPRNPIFLSGYAGANYGRGPRAAYAPTGYLLQYDSPWRRRPYTVRP